MYLEKSKQKRSQSRLKKVIVYNDIKFEVAVFTLRYKSPYTSMI